MKLKKSLAIMLSLIMLLPTAIVPMSVSADALEDTYGTRYFHECFDPAADCDICDANTNPDLDAAGTHFLKSEKIVQAGKASSPVDFYNGWVYTDTRTNTTTSATQYWQLYDDGFRSSSDTTYTKTQKYAMTYNQGLFISSSTITNMSGYISKTLDVSVPRKGKTTITFQYAQNEVSTTSIPTQFNVDGLTFSVDFGKGNTAATGGQWFIPGATSATPINTNTLPGTYGLRQIKLVVDWDNEGAYELYLTPVTGNGTLGTESANLAPSGSKITAASESTGKVEIVVPAYKGPVFVDEINVYNNYKMTPAEIAESIAAGVSGKKRGSITLPTLIEGAEIAWTVADDSLTIIDGQEENTKIINATDEIVKTTITATITRAGADTKVETYSVVLIPNDIYFYEDFEDATAWEGYNGWVKTSYSSLSETETFNESVVTETSGNKAGKIGRKIEGINRSLAMINDFSTKATGGIISVKTDIKLDSLGNHFFMYFGNSSNRMAFTFRPNYSDFLDDGGHPNGGVTTEFLINAATLDLEAWHTIEFVIDMANSKYDLYFDNILMADNYAFKTTITANDLSRIGFQADRLNWSSTIGSAVLFDNIIVSNGALSTGNYAVSNYTFVDGEDAPASGPVAGGKLATVKIMRDNIAKPQVYVAIYNDDGFHRVSTFSTASASKLGTDMPVYAPLPANLNGLKIKTFIWDEETLKPVISSVPYVAE